MLNIKLTLHTPLPPQCLIFRLPACSLWKLACKWCPACGIQRDDVQVVVCGRSQRKLFLIFLDHIQDCSNKHLTT